MKKIKYIFGWVLMLAMGSAQALELSLEDCITEPAQITDMDFVSPNRALLATQSGDIYWFKGCNQAIEKLGTVDVTYSNILGLYSVTTNWDFFLTRKVYVYYASEREGKLVTRLSTFKVSSPNEESGLTDEKILLEIPQPYENSNGGGLRFGPDGALYLGVGDGGSDGDPQGNAQNVQNILGSILRIYPDELSPSGYRIPQNNLSHVIPEADPRIFAFGVRNPWKLTFSHRGKLIIADVGEHKVEEVDMIPMNVFKAKIINLGWNIKEGNECFQAKSCSSKNLTDPVYQYTHGNSGNSITGGETLWVNNREYYMFADFMTGYLGVLDLKSPSQTVLDKIESGKNWTTFGKSPNGQVYVADYNGGIYKVRLTSK